MTPSLRSSLSETPSGKAGQSFVSPSRSNPRKSPTCKTCGQRRAGHPRSGCPSAYSPSPRSMSKEPEITDALMSLDIESDDKATIRATRRSSGVKPVQEPGIISDELSDDEGHKIRVEKWKDTMFSTSTKLTRRSLRSASVMPGTLDTPSSSFFSNEGIPQEPVMIPSQNGSLISIPVVELGSPGPKPLARTLSVEERNNFLNKLAKSSSTGPATVFQLPINDIPSLQQSAMKLGFFSRVIPGVDGVNGYLVLGRDDSAVEGLFDGAKEQARKRVQTRGNKMAAVAGGAMVGAVATFTSLALS